MTNSPIYQHPLPPRVPAHLPHQQPRLTYFITRPNNVPVPLIPLDELPLSVQLVNAPKVLTPDQTYGLHYVGAAPMSVGLFVLEEEQKNARNHGSAYSLGRPALDSEHIGHRHHHSIGSTHPTTATNPIPASSSSTSWRRTTSTPPPPTTASTALSAVLNSTTGSLAASRLNYHPPSSSYTHLPPSGTMPDPDKKEYCTYWILHGDCGFAQQGCRFKHEMPDRKKLREIGILNVPRWWAEKECAIRVGAGGGGILKKGAGEVGEWLKGPGLAMVPKGRSGSETTIESDGTSMASDADGEGSESESVADAVMKGKEQTGAISSVVKPDSKAVKPATTPPARPNTPTSPQKDSSTTSTTTPPPTTSDLLIDFAPLIPSPASSTASFKTPTASPASKSPSTPSNSHITRSQSTTPSKIFVPRGESPAHHIVAAQQHHQRIASQSREKHAASASKRVATSSSFVTKATPGSSTSLSDKPRGRQPSQDVRPVILKPDQRASGGVGDKTDGEKKKKTNETVPLRDLIEEMRKAKTEHAAAAVADVRGLMASRHAPVRGQKDKEEKKRGVRGGRSGRVVGRDIKRGLVKLEEMEMRVRAKKAASGGEKKKE